MRDTRNGLKPSLIKTVDTAAITELLARAEATTRRRLNLNLHAEGEPVSRFLNAGIAGTYARPHRHPQGRWELVTLLHGRFDIVTFSSNGLIDARYALTMGDTQIAEIPGGVWHGVVFAAPGAVVLEIKAGLYDPSADKEFASWAPAESTPDAAHFAAWLEGAAVGEKWA
jgi:cupin fold WbuC family metalloprotein